MKHLKILPLFLLAGSLTAIGCGDKDDGGTSGAATATAGSTGSATATATATATAGDDGDAGDAEGGDGDQGDGDQGDAGDQGDQGDAGDGDGDETGDAFVPMSDVPSVSTCDPFIQDCPEGEKCVAYSSAGDTWDANKCVPVTGSGVYGDVCTYSGSVESTDDCDADHFCWEVNEEGMGVCHAFCTGSAESPQCDPDFSCSIANSGSINLCLPGCDPVLQNCTGGNNPGCWWDGSGFVCAPGTQDIPEGEPCGYINDCTPGMVCLGSEAFPSCAGDACCSAYCDLEDPNVVCAISGTECTPFFVEGEAPPGLDYIGICVIPGA